MAACNGNDVQIAFFLSFSSRARTPLHCLHKTRVLPRSHYGCGFFFARSRDYRETGEISVDRNNTCIMISVRSSRQVVCTAHNPCPLCYRREHTYCNILYPPRTCNPCDSRCRALVCASRPLRYHRFYRFSTFERVPSTLCVVRKHFSFRPRRGQR